MFKRLVFLILLVIAALLTIGSVQVNNAFLAAIWGFNAGMWLMLLISFLVSPSSRRG